MVAKARYDFSGELYASFSGAKGSAAIRSYCPHKKPGAPFSLRRLSAIRLAIRQKGLYGSGVPPSAIQAQQIEYFPGSYRAKLSSQRVVKLKGISSMAVLSQA